MPWYYGVPSIGCIYQGDKSQGETGWPTAIEPGSWDGNMNRYNVDKVLNRLGQNVVVETGDERYLNCPFHSDSDPSFSINSKTGLWVCFAGCGQGNLKGFVSKVLGISFRDAEMWLEGYEEIATVSILKQKLDKTRVPIYECKTEVVNYWSDRMLEPYYNGVMSNYIFQRGFSKEILKEYEVGYDMRTKDIVIPARDEDGKLVGIIKRSTTSGIRYTNSLGFPKKTFLFGLNRIILSTGEKRVFVVEGPLDVIWMAQAKMPAVGLLGSDMTDVQAQLLIKNFITVVLVLDNDKAGMEGTEIARKKLSGKMIVLKGVIPEGMKDVQDMSMEEIENIKIERVGGNYARYASL